MKVISKSKIFLSDGRGCDETESFRRYSTFNFGKYFNQYKKPFKNLYVLNDETIAGGQSVKFQMEEASYILLLPVAGSVVCKINESIESLVHPGQLNIIRVLKNDSIEFLNCYENELINFLQVWIKAGDGGNDELNTLFNFNFDENKNQLITVTSNVLLKEPVVSIGKFEGRHEAVYKPQDTENILFAFVIQGVFEVEGRLLHARDGLALWNGLQQVEMEALSNDAIIFIIELSSIDFA